MKIRHYATLLPADGVTEMLPGRWSHRDSRTPTAVNTTRRVLTFPSTLGNVAEPCPFHVPRRKSNCSGKTCELPERADNLVRSQGPYRPALRFGLSLGLSLRFLRRPAFGGVFGRLCRRSSPASRRHFFPVRATSNPHRNELVRSWSLLKSVATTCYHWPVATPGW